MVLIAAAAIHASAAAQDDKDTAEASPQTQNIDEQQRDSRWLWGGGLGFGWSEYEWRLHVSPQAGYRINDYFVLGGGLSYSYYKGRGGFDYRTNLFGVNGTVRFFPVRRIFIFAQPEVFFQWGKAWGYKVSSDPFFCMPMGAGVVFPVGRGGVFVSLSYDVIQNRYSPYGDNINASVGYMFRW